MIRISKDNYTTGAASLIVAPKGSVIKSWDLTEIEGAADIPAVDLAQFLETCLGPEHEVVQAASEGGVEKPLSVEACEAVLTALENREANEAEQQVKRQSAEEAAAARGRAEAESIIQNARREAAELLENARHEAALTEQNAVHFLEQAQGKAQEILLEAEARQDEVFAMAAAEARHEALEAVRQRVLAFEERGDARLLELTERLGTFMEEREAALEKNILALSVEIAEKIIDAELDKSNELYLALTRRAIAKLNAKAPFVLYMTKREHERLTAADVVQLKKQLPGVSFSIVSDESLEAGALLLRADEGTVDAGVKTQFERLREFFKLEGEAQ